MLGSIPAASPEPAVWTLTVSPTERSRSDAAICARPPQSLAGEPVRQDGDERGDRGAIELSSRLLNHRRDVRALEDPVELLAQLVDVARQPSSDICELFKSHR